MRISAYWKSIVAGLGPVVLAAQAAVTDGIIDNKELVTIGVALLVAFGVWRVPNDSEKLAG